ncbi:hypothetical protein DF185_13375 [Marinifilum breve]|uniref:Phosphatidic acid phosphatase type 2/haloperoxidase domain-containing protein n=1 Tax=Marinifilum breve TaxID=2184082 RepID=A0A2V3ZX99_9BACT|nr:phosphatase PAP2 family protein [Marinifilum breve]PXY00883.1 hypothetical protein DF185_13375 [Marinifilum breve]
MKKKCLILIFSFISLYCVAQKTDTINSEIPYHKPTFLLKNKALPIAVGIVGLGVALEYSNSDKHWWQNKYSFQNKVRENFPGFSTRSDDYLRYAPLALAVGMNISKNKAEHRIIGQLARLISAQIIMDATVNQMKKKFKHLRPNGHSYTSFPSAHTAQAFLSARFLDKEFGKEHNWVRWLGYGMAATTGACRILNNSHWVSDVLVGAGIGVLSVDLTYWLFDKLGNKKLMIAPIAGKDMYGINLVYRF